jgi:phage-related protein
MANKFTVSTVFAAVDSMSGTIGKMDANVGKMGDNVSKNLKKMGSGFGEIGKVVGGVASSIAGLAMAVGTAMYKMSVDVALYGDKIAKAARYTGITTDALQEFRYVGELSGIAVEEMDKSMAELNKRIGEGSGTTADALAKMGLNIDDLKNADPNKILEIVADGFQTIENPADKAAIACALFGDAGLKLINVLDTGSAGIEAMAQEAHDLGYVMDEELLNASENLNDDMLRMKTTFKAVQNMLAGEFIPIIDNVIDKITEVSIAGKSQFAGAFTGIANVLAELFLTLLPVLDSVFGLLVPLLNLLAIILKGLAPLFAMIAGIIEKLVPIVGLLADILSVLLGPALDMVVMMLEPVIDILGILLKVIAPVLKAVLWLSQIIVKAFNSIPGPVKNVIFIVIGLLNPIVGFPFLLAGVWRPLKAIIPDIINWIIEAAKKMGTFFVDLWGNIVDIFNVSMDTILFLPEKFISFIDSIITSSSGLGDFFKNLWAGIVDIFKVAIDVISFLLAPMIDMINFVGAGLDVIGLGDKKNKTPMSNNTAAIKSTTNKSTLDVNFNNTPAGTTAKQTGTAPGINVNMGYAYAMGYTK